MQHVLLHLHYFFFFFYYAGEMLLRIPCPEGRAGYVGLALFNGPYPLKLQRVSYLRRYWGRAGISSAALLPARSPPGALTDCARHPLSG